MIIKIQRFSIQDGPGIRTTVFLKGCPLRCLWCSNPEGQEPYPELMYNKFACLPDCTLCVDTCVKGALRKIEGRVVIDRIRCDACGECVRVCPSKALVIVGTYVRPEDVLKVVLRDREFYERSDGGVTLSGGEPLYQPVFTKELLRLCKVEGINTALDTSGYASWEVIEGILKYTDVILYDIKHTDPQLHKRYTGVSNDLILDNLKKIDALGIPVIIRIPIIPGLNDSYDNLSRTADFILKLNSVVRVDLLPYHRLGEPKYEMLGREYPLKGLRQPDREYMLKIVEIFKQFGVKADVIG
jgi:pyruvate formate lyase activating enzyme